MERECVSEWVESMSVAGKASTHITIYFVGWKF